MATGSWKKATAPKGSRETTLSFSEARHFHATRAAFWEIIAIPDIRSQCATLAVLLATQDEEWQFERIGAQSP